MAANAGLVNTIKLRHRLLRGPDGFIFDYHLHLAFVVGQLVEYELYLVAQSCLSAFILVFMSEEHILYAFAKIRRISELTKYNYKGRERWMVLEVRERVERRKA